jgi:hypothetical protein
MLQQVVDRLGAGGRRRVGAGSAGRGVRRRPTRASVRFGGVVVLLALAVDGVVVARAAHDASDAGVAAVYPACAATALQGVDGVRVFAPYFDSGYLVRRLWPQAHVYLYGEAASFGQRVFDDYERIYAGGPDALGLLRASDTNVVLVGPGALQQTLVGDGGWRRVLVDPMGATLYATPGLSVRLQAPAGC